jgi:hypothetical protein
MELNYKVRLTDSGANVSMEKYPTNTEVSKENYET